MSSWRANTPPAHNAAPARTEMSTLELDPYDSDAGSDVDDDDAIRAEQPGSVAYACRPELEEPCETGVRMATWVRTHAGGAQRQGETALMIAARYGQYDVVNLVLQHSYGGRPQRAACKTSWRNRAHARHRRRYGRRASSSCSLAYAEPPPRTQAAPAADAAKTDRRAGQERRDGVAARAARRRRLRRERSQPAPPSSRRCCGTAHDVNVADANGFTPLMASVRRGFGAVTQALLQRGANVTAATAASGTTVLMLAAAANDAPTIQRLFEAADPAEYVTMVFARPVPAARRRSTSRRRRERPTRRPCCSKQRRRQRAERHQLHAAHGGGAARPVEGCAGASAASTHRTTSTSRRTPSTSCPM